MGVPTAIPDSARGITRELLQGRGQIDQDPHAKCGMTSDAKSS